MPGFFARLTRRLFDSTIAAEVKRRIALTVREIDRATDRMLSSGGNTEGWRDRFAFDRDQVQRQALQAWRENPLAKRIISLTTQYVVGGGITAESKHKRTDAFIKEFWEHRLNRMAVRCMEWCDELSRAGNLFVVVSTNVDGMSYVRALPADNIDRIEARENDVEQPLRIIERQRFDEAEPRVWDAYDEASDEPDAEGNFKPVVLHYAINRPVGAQWGESDLAPILKWISRFASWLEDRVRLNHFRQIFLFIVKGKFANALERATRQAELNARPPAPGSILVTDENESWEVVSAKLDSFEAGTDGLAVKKNIAAGASVPLHFLAEPESSTKSTAESAGGPTYRHYQQRQIVFVWLILDVLKVAIRRRSLVRKDVSVRAAVNVRGTDISAKDNAALALAARAIVGAFSSLYDRGIIDEEELIRLSYNFAGELADVPELLKKVVAPRFEIKPPATNVTTASPEDTTKVDTETGAITGTGALAATVHGDNGNGHKRLRVIKDIEYNERGQMHRIIEEEQG